MIILGIETSCDETALAIIETRTIKSVFELRILSSLIHSQAELHSPYGGVFPMLAKREHEKHLQPLLDKMMADTKVKLDAIAVTEGPGLEPALWTGITFAQELGKKLDIPVIPVDHMEGHILGSLLASDAPDNTWQKLKNLPMPSLAFLISGGHTELVLIKPRSSIRETTDQSSELSNLEYTIIGATKDDAVGEAFDKVARLLGLPYPGGPHVSKLAHEARQNNIISTVTLPRPMIHSKDLHFSFSGLKTAVLYAVREAEKSNTFTEAFKKALCCEFEDAVTETLTSKLKTAIEETGTQSIIIGGGVSANIHLRQHFSTIADTFNIPLYLPSQHISGDNALMIALTGALNYTPAATLRAQGTKKLSV